MAVTVAFLYGDALYRAELRAVVGDRARVFVPAFGKEIEVGLSRVFPSLAALAETAWEGTKSKAVADAVRPQLGQPGGAISGRGSQGVSARAGGGKQGRADLVGG